MKQIEVRNLSKLYKETEKEPDGAGPRLARKGLQPLSFEVAQGELVAIVGHNGAGKSTLLKMLAGWIRPDAGQVEFAGIGIAHRKTLARLVGFVSEVPNLFEFFSVEYNLKLVAALFHLPPSRVEEVLSNFDLLSYRKSKIYALSKGLKQRVSIARTLIANPAVLLFDEPTSGLDFEMTRDVYQMLKSMHRMGKTILFTTHRPEEIREFATRILVLHQGQLVFDGTPENYFQSVTRNKLRVWG